MSQPYPLTEEQRDRAAGVLLGAACGDALGVPYEFAAPPPPGEEPRMAGGGLGPYEPGEYSDDTQMAVCIARVTATGADPRDSEVLDQIARAFVDWLREGATDVGIQTRSVLGGVQAIPERNLALVLREGAETMHGILGKSAGNGSLMRCAVLALAYLGDPAGMVESARAVSALTHFDPLAADACVLWCSGVRRAVLDGTFDGVREGLTLLPAERRGMWVDWLDEAERHPPARFTPNGFVVTALQAAWSAVRSVRREGPEGLRHGLVAAVRAGDDTDTVAAIAGALLGARHGASAIPKQWRDAIHGWPGLTADDLMDLAVRTAERSR